MRRNRSLEFTGKRANLIGLESIDFIEGSLADASVCERACHGVEVIFHEACASLTGYRWAPAYAPSREGDIRDSVADIDPISSRRMSLGNGSQGGDPRAMFRFPQKLPRWCAG